MRKSSPLTGAIVLATALVAGIGATSRADAAASPTALISGSGSSWAANAVNQWSADLVPDGLQVTYIANGSPQGKVDFAHATADFAVTDVPYLGDDESTGVNDTSDGRDYSDIPLAAGGTSFPYHLMVHGQLTRTLRLSGLTLAKIFTGQITNWDSPQIAADNNGVQLPSLAIKPVVHSEASGVTWEFTTYLADEYPTFWQRYAASTLPTQYWPATAHQIVQNGSDSVINYIKSASANGAIGMDEYAYALGANFPVAKVENRSGYFVLPTQYNVAIALRSATIDENSADATYMRPDLVPVFTSTDRRAYPLSTYSSMLIPTSATDSKMTTARRQTLAEFAYYSICQGQKQVGPIGYAPLPLNLVTAGFTQIERLKTADPAVDLTGINVSTCDNPTFNDQKPSLDTLGAIAPQPVACDKAGQGPCGVTTVARLTASASTVKAGHPVTFHGRLAFVGAAGGPPHVLVALQRQKQHGSWTTVATKPTSSSATATFTRTVGSTASFRLVVAQPGSGAPSSTPVKVTVTLPPHHHEH